MNAFLPGAGVGVAGHTRARAKRRTRAPYVGAAGLSAHTAHRTWPMFPLIVPRGRSR